MQNRKKSFLVVFVAVLAITALFLPSHFFVKSISIEKKVLAESIAVNQDGQNYKIAVLIEKIDKNNPAFEVLTASGDTFENALKNINEQTDKVIFYGHLENILFDDTISDSAIDSVKEFFYKNYSKFSLSATVLKIQNSIDFLKDSTENNVFVVDYINKKYLINDNLKRVYLLDLANANTDIPTI